MQILYCSDLEYPTDNNFEQKQEELRTYEYAKGSNNSTA